MSGYERVKRFEEMCEVYNQMIDVLDKKRKHELVVNLPEKLYDALLKSCLLKRTDCINEQAWNIFKGEKLLDKYTFLEFSPQVLLPSLENAIDLQYNRIAAAVIESYMQPEVDAVSDPFFEAHSADEIRALTGFSKRKIKGMKPQEIANKMMLEIEQVVDREPVQMPPPPPPQIPMGPPPLFFDRKKKLISANVPFRFKIPKPPLQEASKKRTREEVIEATFERNFNLKFKQG